MEEECDGDRFPKPIFLQTGPVRIFARFRTKQFFILLFFFFFINFGSRRLKTMMSKNEKVIRTSTNYRRPFCFCSSLPLAKFWTFAPLPHSFHLLTPALITGVIISVGKPNRNSIYKLYFFFISPGKIQRYTKNHGSGRVSSHRIKPVRFLTSNACFYRNRRCSENSLFVGGGGVSSINSTEITRKKCNSRCVCFTNEMLPRNRFRY